MAASTLTKPGKTFGPCEGKCEHRDCAETRKMAAQFCQLCGEPIGFGVRFYTDPDDGAELVHAACLEDA